MGLEWIVISLAVGALLGGTALAGLSQKAKATTWQDEIEARWREAAERLGGRLDVDASGALAPRRLHLVATLEDVEVSARATVPAIVPATAPGPGLGSYTEARARYLLGAGPTFEAHPRGRHPHEDGEQSLPERPAHLESVDPDALGVALSPQARALLDGMPHGVDLEGDGARVRLRWDGTERRVDVLERAMRLVATLARHGADHLRDLARLDGARWEPRDARGPRVRVRRGQAEVSLRVRRVDGAAATFAIVETRHAVPRFQVEIAADGSLDGELPEGVVDPSFAHHLGRVGRAVLRGEGDAVALGWRAPPTELQAEAAVTLLAPISKGSGAQGAFR